MGVRLHQSLTNPFENSTRKSRLRIYAEPTKAGIGHQY